MNDADLREFVHTHYPRLVGAVALLHEWAGRLSPLAWAGVVVAGIGLRLALYTVALTALSLLETLHWPSLAFATAVGLVGTLTVEVAVLTKRPELFWLLPNHEGVDR